jgi:hypothetical protein
MTDVDMSIYRGDDKTWTITFVDSNGTAINITGYSVFFTVKPENTYVDSSSDTGATISKTVSVHSDPTHGVTSLSLVPLDTASLKPAKYRYDMQLKNGSGKILTFIAGNFEVLADVTRRTV